MSVNHHADDSQLLSYAAGAGGEAEALLVATHVALCPHCRAEASLMEAVGGTLLSGMPPMAMEGGAVDTVLARLDAHPISRGPREKAVEGPNAIPAPLRPYVGPSFDRVRWTPVTHGLSYRMLIRKGGTRAYLTRSRPGAGIGLHTHRGNELTLVLSGGFSDELGSYARGDLIATDPEITHSPVADDDGDCITLAMTDARLIFRNKAAGLVARVFGF